MQKARKKNAMAQRRTGTLWGAPAAGFGTPCPGCCKSLSFIVTFITSIRGKAAERPRGVSGFPIHFIVADREFSVNFLAYVSVQAQMFSLSKKWLRRFFDKLQTF